MQTATRIKQREAEACTEKKMCWICSCKQTYRLNTQGRPVHLKCVQLLTQEQTKASQFE